VVPLHLAPGTSNQDPEIRYGRVFNLTAGGVVTGVRAVFSTID